MDTNPELELNWREFENKEQIHVYENGFEDNNPFEDFDEDFDEVIADGYDDTEGIEADLDLWLQERSVQKYGVRENPLIRSRNPQQMVMQLSTNSDREHF